MTIENNNNPTPNREALETLKEELFAKHESGDGVKEIAVSPEELINTLYFMKNRIADLTFELAHAQSKYAKLVYYTRKLEERLEVEGKDLTELKHPDTK